jgi:hypothetical protein
MTALIICEGLAKLSEMVEQWLVDLMASYNAESLAKKEQYSAQVHMRGHLFEELVWWALQALPDEILVGLDVDSKSANRLDVETKYRSFSHRRNLFQGQGYIINEARIVNRGDSYSVHHLPEEWTDGLFSGDRGSRAGRFTHWLHTHPNAPAIPSNADADAAQETNGIDMILGLRFSPEGPLPWFDDVEGQRRTMGDAAKVVKKAGKKRRSFFARNSLPVLGVAPSGHKIHELQLIAFHKSGAGINVILVDEEGHPIE